MAVSGGVRVYEVGRLGEYVVSARGMWIPGVYATPDAAIAAAHMDEDRLNALWDRACKSMSCPLLTEADLADEPARAEAASDG